MGQNITKFYTVSLGSVSDPSQHVFGSIQEAIDAVDPGSTIILSQGDHSGPNNEFIRLKSSIRFIGLQGARIISPVIGDVCDVVFDNIIFKNYDNQSLEFKDGKGFLFRNCEFQINICGNILSRYNPDIRFGFHLIGGSALLQNPIFCVNVENVEVFVVIGADCGATYLSLQSPIIRTQYKNIYKLETFFFRGVKDSCTIPYFESFSSSIHYLTDTSYDFVYDGHCCLKKRNPRQCTKRHCGRCEGKVDRHCKQVHSCCYKKCTKSKIEPTRIRLFRGLDCVNSSLNNTKIYFIEGKGLFNIASGDTPIYINALTASTTSSLDWEIGDFRNILLTSFQSNLKCACEIEECHCIKESTPEDESEETSTSSSETDDSSSSSPRNNCTQCRSLQPCRCPFPPSNPCNQCGSFNPCKCLPTPPFIPIPPPDSLPIPCGSNPSLPCFQFSFPSHQDDSHRSRKPKSRKHSKKYRSREAPDDSARYY